MRQFKDDKLPRKNLLSMQIDLNKFAPATDAEKAQHETMRESTTFFRDGMNGLPVFLHRHGDGQRQA